MLTYTGCLKTGSVQERLAWVQIVLIQNSCSYEQLLLEYVQTGVYYKPHMGTQLIFMSMWMRPNSGKNDQLEKSKPVVNDVGHFYFITTTLFKISFQFVTVRLIYLIWSFQCFSN